MVSTFTPNIQIEEPARGDDVGTWDTPVNNNMTLLDSVVGGVTSLSLNNSPVVLSAPQFQSKTITFFSTLTGNVAITFPTSFTKSYEIRNICTGSSAFVVTLQTTVAGGQVVCAPPGEITDITITGGSIFYKSFGHIGSYWDYAGSSVPAWISGCTALPYLNCDGTGFSSASFPQLTAILGGTTLPDFRGSVGLYSNQGTGRATSTGAGVNGDTIGARGGSNGATLFSSNIPSLNSSGTNTISVQAPSQFFATATGTALINTSVGGSPIFQNPSVPSSFAQGSNLISVAYTNPTPSPVPSALPVVTSGLRLIRAG